MRTRHALAGGKQASMVTLFYEDAALTESGTLAQEKKLQFKALEKNPSQALLEQVKLCSTMVSAVRVQVGTHHSDPRLINVAGAELPMRDLSDGCRSGVCLS